MTPIRNARKEQFVRDPIRRQWKVIMQLERAYQEAEKPWREAQDCLHKAEKDLERWTAMRHSIEVTLREDQESEKLLVAQAEEQRAKKRLRSQVSRTDLEKKKHGESLTKVVTACREIADEMRNLVRDSIQQLGKTRLIRTRSGNSLNRRARSILTESVYSEINLPMGDPECASPVSDHPAAHAAHAAHAAANSSPPMGSAGTSPMKKQPSTMSYGAGWYDLITNKSSKALNVRTESQQKTHAYLDYIDEEEKSS